jgi:hypothetical protein
LELGIYPIRFEIMKRKIIFLQYILKQDKNSMIYKVFKATSENPVKNDFVETCKKYLKQLDIKLTFEEISEMSSNRLKNIVKQKTEEAGFNHLLKEKNKQKKIVDIEYKKLEIQEYLKEGNRNTRMSKIIFKARGKNLEIKMHKKWRYSDVICVGCGEKVESEEELLLCDGFLGNKEIPTENIKYSWSFGSYVSLMVKVAKSIEMRLKVRKSLIEEPG